MKDWMKNIPDETLISEINIPGTHDSAAQFVQFSYFSKCQESSIWEQLNNGIRFLDLRVEKTGDILRLVHARAKCYKTAEKKEPLLLEDVISDCKKFLDSHPSEAIIVSIKRDAGASSAKTFKTFFKHYLSKDIYWFTENRIPVLREVRGKLVFFNRFEISENKKKYDDSNTGLNFSNWPDQSVYENFNNPFARTQMERRDKAFILPVILQDFYKLSPSEKWEKAILPNLQTPPCRTGLFISFFSTGTFLKNPKRSAKHILKAFSDEELQSMKKYGWMIFDFPTEKICRKVVLTNF